MVFWETCIMGCSFRKQVYGIVLNKYTLNFFSQNYTQTDEKI